MKASRFHDPGPKPTIYVGFGPGSWKPGLAGPEATTVRHSRTPRTTTAAARRQRDGVILRRALELVMDHRPQFPLDLLRSEPGRPGDRPPVTRTRPARDSLKNLVRQQIAPCIAGGGDPRDLYYGAVGGSGFLPSRQIRIK